MKSIKICSAEEATRLNPKEKTLLIRIFNSRNYQGDYVPEDFKLQNESKFQEILKYEFDDILPPMKYLIPDLRLFDRWHAREILEDSAYYMDSLEHLVVHCRMGISRSSAIAKSLNQIFSLKIPEEEYLYPGIHRPNSHIYETMIQTAKELKII